MRSFAAFTSIALLGCTTYWSNPTNPQANFERDKYECQIAARTGQVSVYVAAGKPSPATTSAAIVQSADRISATADEMYWAQRCLQARGWRPR